MYENRKWTLCEFSEMQNHFNLKGNPPLPNLPHMIFYVFASQMKFCTMNKWVVTNYATIVENKTCINKKIPNLDQKYVLVSWKRSCLLIYSFILFFSVFV